MSFKYIHSGLPTTMIQLWKMAQLKNTSGKEGNNMPA